MFHHIAIILPADLRTYKIPNFYFQKGWKIPLFVDHNVKIAKEDVLLPLFTWYITLTSKALILPTKVGLCLTNLPSQLVIQRIISQDIYELDGTNY